MKPTFILLAISLLLAACGTAAPEPTAVPPTSTPLPSATPTVTPSPEPTVTPEPTPIPMTMDDVHNMSDEDKLAHVTGYEGSNMSVSTLHPHIVLIDGDDDSVAYNILTGEVTDLAAVNIELIHTVNGETKEVWSFGASEINEGVRIITADVGDGIYDADKMELHPNGNSHLRFVKSLGSDLKPLGAFSLDGAAFGGVGNYWVFYQEYKGNRTFVVYLDSDGKYRYALFRIDPKQFKSRTIFSG